MDYVPKMVPLTTNDRWIHDDYRDQLDRWHSSGRPPQGLYSYKLDFGAEILRESPPTIIGSATKHSNRQDFRDAVSDADTRDEEALRRRAFQMTGIDENDFVPALWSEDLAIWAANGDVAGGEWTAWRHGDCHELIFVHNASEPFDILTDFGVLEDVGTGDFIYLPRGTTYAFPESADASMLLYESPEPLYRPYDYWMGDQQPWPFPPEATRPPAPKLDDPEADYDREALREVVVKRRTDDYTSLHYETPVFDTVAWEGETWPFALNLEDMTVLTSPDFHLDPPKVTAFVSENEGMYLQTFLPRWMQSPPYNHLNSVDEALFNHHGYEARPDVSDGYLTLHPTGVPHGPDPRVVEDLAEEGEIENPKEEIPWANEIGIMVESQSPFSALTHARRVEVDGYNESWSDVARDQGMVAE